MIAAISVSETSWRAPYFDLRAGLFAPQLITLDPEPGEREDDAAVRGRDRSDSQGGGRGRFGSRNKADRS